jgi:hypothetical protein
MKRIGMMSLFLFAVTAVASQPEPGPGQASVRPQPTNLPGLGAVFASASQEKKSKMVGFGIGPEFDDDAPEGGLLIGFGFGLNYGVNSNGEIIAAIQPIYRVGDKEKLGKLQGSETKRTVKEVAKTGYAVAGIHAKGALVVDGLYITYMKVDGNHLDPNDAYNSKWIGGPGGNGPTGIGGTGRQVVGIHGRLNPHNKKDVVAIGLTLGPPLTELLQVDESKKPEEPKIPKFPRFIGGWNDPEFTDNAPANGQLVGFDFAYGGLGGKTIITVQPIYQVKGKTKDVSGQIHGTDTKNRARDRAKPGYAVGAIKVKGGLWVEGFSIVYMKIDDEKLDPSDSYETNWFGSGDGNDAALLTGEGTPVVGVLGRQKGNLTAFGLVFKGDRPEPKDKDKKKQ